MNNDKERTFSSLLPEIFCKVEEKKEERTFTSSIEDDSFCEKVKNQKDRFFFHISKDNELNNLFCPECPKEEKERFPDNCWTVTTYLDDWLHMLPRKTEDKVELPMPCDVSSGLITEGHRALIYSEYPPGRVPVWFKFSKQEPRWFG